ncbi:glutaredoxin domain-containing protein [Ruegeria sp. SCP11]|uniref:glutaredoxin domain-containing protein n=1 Tax=Ruegeria sp. SCP11 TaxID=3141378 RepID=UPI003338E181
MSITVYSKPACVQCTGTTRALDAKGIIYDVVELTEDHSAMIHLTELSYRQAPVFVADSDHWSGFLSDMIAQLA